MSRFGDAVSNKGGPGAVRRWVNYTGKTINSVNANRTAINADLKVGDVLVMDPFGWGRDPSNPSSIIAGPNRGRDFTQPQTSYLSGPKVYVVEVPAGVNDIPDSTAATQRRGGLVCVESLNPNAQVNTAANMTAGTTFLGVQNGSFALAAVANPAASATAFGQTCGLANETVDTSGGNGPAVKSVAFGITGIAV